MTKTKTKPTIKLPNLFPWQQEVYNSPHRFRILSVGRRAGKSYFAAILAVEAALQGKSAWWIAPTYNQAQIGWMECKNLSVQINQQLKSISGCDHIQFRLKDQLIEFDSGGTIRVRTGMEPDNLRGFAMDIAILDECAFLKEEIWTSIVRPSLITNQGKALFLSTPCGQNWFFELWKKGIKQNSIYRSWQLPQWVNPLIPQTEIDQARLELPSVKFQEEIEAKFVDGSACAVFQNFRKCISDCLQEEPIEGHNYLVSVDWGRSHDFSVFCVIDTTENSLCNITRINQVDYVVQRNLLQGIVHKFKPKRIICEANSIGQTNIEELNRIPGFPQVIPFVTTNPSKCNAIETLQLSFIKEEIAIPNDPNLLEELGWYTFKRSLRNNMTIYGTESEMKHDDIIMSLAIGWWSHKKNSKTLTSFNRSLIGI